MASSPRFYVVPRLIAEQVHFLPIILTRPRTLLGTRRILTTLIAALRSACFLSAFVASYWYAVCFTRTLVLARFLPWISHDFWDGPYGCLLAGSLVCGNSIWIENGLRRGEMALYVLPRAFRTCLSNSWLNGQNRVISLLERYVYNITLLFPLLMVLSLQSDFYCVTFYSGDGCNSPS